MKITRIVVSLAAASVLALSACGGDSTTTDPGSSEPTTAAEPNTEETQAEPATEAEGEGEGAGDDAAAPANEGEADPAAGGAAESPNNAASPAVDAFIAAHEGAERMPAEALSGAGSVELIKQMEIEPAECKEATVKFNELQAAGDAEKDGAMLLDEATGKSTGVSVMKFADAAQADEIIAASKEVAAKCADAKLAQGGQELTMKQDLNDASIDGASKAINMTVSTTVGEMQQASHTTIAIKDSTLVSAHVSGDGASVEETDALAAEIIEALG